MYNYFSNDPFYRKFDIAVDVKRLIVQRRFSAGDFILAEERDAIRITIVNLWDVCGLVMNMVEGVVIVITFPLLHFHNENKTIRIPEFKLQVWVILTFDSFFLTQIMLLESSNKLYISFVSSSILYPDYLFSIPRLRDYRVVKKTKLWFVKNHKSWFLSKFLLGINHDCALLDFVFSHIWDQRSLASTAPRRAIFTGRSKTSS